MDKYVKVVYQTQPIGPERIILYLTTFDKEAFERDQQLIPKQEAMSFEFDKSDIKNPDFIKGFEGNLNTIVKEYYGEKIKELEEIAKTKQFESKTVAMPIKEKIRNITNADDVHCDVVYGNITNCDNIYCSEVKGNIVNCDKVIYK